MGKNQRTPVQIMYVHDNSHRREVCEGNLFGNHRFGKLENQTTRPRSFDDKNFFCPLFRLLTSRVGVST
ncbi:MAG: hypothetical protein DMG05_26675 [Acidobacteria bacterium]|nr:MAG: hypothetical protein DMG05_26675 [Acidobacteriota bacterium]